MSISESAGEHAAWCYLRTGYNWGGDRALKHPLMDGVNRVRGYLCVVFEEGLWVYDYANRIGYTYS